MVHQYRAQLFDDRDRVLLDEAVACRDGGALRAAYIMTWIAIAEGLRWRFVEMSTRDADMATFVEETNRLEADGATVDQRILDRAKTSGVVSQTEHKQLTYLKDMRNSFAHPTGAAPSREEVDAAIKVAVTVVLNRRPLLGYGYARGLANTIISDRHYLDDDEQKVCDYTRGLSVRLQPGVAPWLVGELIARMSAIMADPQLNLFVRRGTWMARELVRATAGNLADAPWKTERWLVEHPVSACRVFGDVEIFRRVGDHLGDIVYGHLVEPVVGGVVVAPSIDALQMAIRLRSAGITDAQSSCLDAAIGRTPYSTLQNGISLQEWFRKVLTDLASHNWYVQNPAASALDSLGPSEVAKCPPDIQEAIGRTLLAAADGTASRAEDLLSRMQQVDASDWPAAMVTGLLLECLVHESGEFRVKPKKLGQVLAVVSARPDASAIADVAAIAINAADTAKYGPEGYSVGERQVAEIQCTGDAAALQEKLTEAVARRRLRQ